MKIKTGLRALILITLLPVAAVGIATAYMLLEQQLQTIERGARDRVRAIMTAVDTELRSAVTPLEVLARSPTLAADDLDAFRAEAQRALDARHGEWANVLVSHPETAQMLLNLRVPPGEPLSAPSDPETVVECARSVRPVIGRIAIGKRAQRLLFAVRVPVVRDGAVKYVISALVEPSMIAQVVEKQSIPETWALGVLDRDLRFVVRWPQLAQRTGSPHESLVQALGESGEGWQRGRLRDGTEVYRAFQRSSFSGWSLSIAIPRSEVRAGLQATWMLIAGVTSAAAIGLWIAWILAARMTRAIAALASAAPAIGRGDVSALPPPAPIDEVRELATALGDAARAIRDREQRQTAAEQALRSADRAKDEFLAMLGHELRNPLASVSNVALLLKHARQQPALLDNVSAVLERQVKHMTHLVDDLLDMGRVTGGKIRLEREPLDLAAVVAELVAAWRAAGRFSSHELSTHLEPAWVAADAERMEQIVGNLLDNALKYTPAGGSISISVRREASQSMLQISDTGEGIAPELIGRMFDLFVQGERTLAREPGGLGIGLTMAKRLVELHGGAISAHSEGPGKGATLTVAMPVIEAPATQREPAARPTARLDMRRVLVIEDNEDARESLAALLRHAGHEVHTAAEGRSGVALARQLTPDFALVDIGLPDIDGYEVARQVRACPRLASMHLVAITGYGNQNDRRRALANGFEQHFTKPVDFEAIDSLLRTA